MDALDILHSVPFDDTVTHKQWHTHLPYASMTLNRNDEIRIPIQQQDVCVIPAESYLCVEGKLLLDTDGGGVPTKTSLSNNAFAYLFDEIRYEINNVEIERVRNPGITSSLKGYVSLSEPDLKSLTNQGWNSTSTKLKNTISAVDSKGNFNICMSLDKLFGFAEDYRKMFFNTRHELVLIRSSTDDNALLWTPESATDATTENVKVVLDKLYWRVPYITVSDKQRIALLNVLQEGRQIPVEYRGWELYEYPILPSTTKHSWSVKTATQLEKPRYVIVAFQTGRKNNVKKNTAKFDHCNLTNVKLHLNSVSYPYDDLRLDFDSNKYAVLYDMYTRFQQSYYDEKSQPLFTRDEFREIAPIVVIDCSKQNESLRAGPVDIRLEFEASKDFPAGTAAYCLIIHEKSFTYDPSTGLVRKPV